MKIFRFFILLFSVICLTNCENDDNQELVKDTKLFIEIPDTIIFEYLTPVNIPYTIQSDTTIKKVYFQIDDGPTYDWTEITANNLSLRSEEGSINLSLDEIMLFGGNTTSFDFKLSVEDIDGNVSGANLHVSYLNEGICITNNINTDTEWKKEFVYILCGFINVSPEVTLTIQPGTIIKGKEGVGTAATSLSISKGAKLIAKGTPRYPIIFTSVLDEITPKDIENGNFGSPNLESSMSGLWGGLLIRGNAKISINEDWESFFIPELDASYVLYGGNDNNDSSGELNYVSIRHGGTILYPERFKWDGLILAGVGRNTSVKNIEIVSSADDGLAILGGTVNVENLIIWNESSDSDDAIYTDQAFAGSINNSIIINPGELAFNLNGPKGNYSGPGHAITNAFVFMGSAFGGYKDDENTDAIVSNIYFTGFNESTGTFNQYNENGNFKAFNLQMDDSYLNTAGERIFINTEDYFLEMINKVDESGNPIVTEVEPGTQTVGVNSSNGFEWTWTYQSGKLSEVGLN